MAQFGVYRLPDTTWVVSVQSDLVSDYRTTLVIPLVAPDEDATSVSRLNPSFEVLGEQRLLATQLMASVVSRHLGPVQGSLSDHDFEIKAAIDVLINGF